MIKNLCKYLKETLDEVKDITEEELREKSGKELYQILCGLGELDNFLTGLKVNAEKKGATINSEWEKDKECIEKLHKFIDIEDDTCRYKVVDYIAR